MKHFKEDKEKLHRQQIKLLQEYEKERYYLSSDIRYNKFGTVNTY